MSRRGIDAGGGHGDDLLITPLLDLFVALIPFLIISVVLTKINVVDVGISKPVAQVAPGKDSHFELVVKISDAAAEIVLNGKTVKSVARSHDGAWIQATRAVLVGLKRDNPDEVRIRVEPQGSVKLQDLMAFMDGARKLKPEDGEIIRKDGKGNSVKLQYLFPNVVLRGIYG